MGTFCTEKVDFGLYKTFLQFLDSSCKKSDFKVGTQTTKEVWFLLGFKSIVRIFGKYFDLKNIVLFWNLHFDLARRQLCYLEDSCATQFPRRGKPTIQLMFLNFVLWSFFIILCLFPLFYYGLFIYMWGHLNREVLLSVFHEDICFHHLMYYWVFREKIFQNVERKSLEVFFLQKMCFHFIKYFQKRDITSQKGFHHLNDLICTECTESSEC